MYGPPRCDGNRNQQLSKSEDSPGGWHGTCAEAVLASQRNPSHSQLVFFSPDTDVLVLVTANYDMLLKNTSVSMTSGVVHIGAVWKALGPARAKALPAFHAFTGADNTGRFSRVGKSTWLQAYLRTDEDVINALQMLEE